LLRSPQWVSEVEYVCTDPVEYGHVDAVGTSAQPYAPRDTAEQDRKDEEAREERRRVIENNKAWRAATAVRREWLSGLLGRKTAPKGAVTYIATELITGRFMGRNGTDAPRLAYELFGTEQPEQSTDGRCLIVALGVILGAYEANTTEQAWRDPAWAGKRAAMYLSQLVEWGYELSEIEQSGVDSAGDEVTGRGGSGYS
jgi:ParB family transcriptional regulator, chromosome partitioning protein